MICQYCTNHCSRTIVTFSDGQSFVTGNRCERGEVTANPDDPETKKLIAEITKKMMAVPDMVKRTNQLLVKDYTPAKLLPQTGKTIGIPRVLDFWSSLPFWKAFFTSLGYTVVVSKQSDYKLFERGLQSIASDTICFPAKLVHGHVLDLVDKKVNSIFFPMMVAMPSDHTKFKKATAVCPVVQGYPDVSRNSDDPEGNYGIPMIQPVFHWTDTEQREKQTVAYFHERWGIKKSILKKAVAEGERALNTFRSTLAEEGAKVLEDVRKKGDFAICLAGRPYHADTLINHNIAQHFTTMGIPVLTTESLPGVFDQDLDKHTRMEVKNTFHMRMLGATMLAAKDPALELVQIVSFGCGHDSVLTDEMNRMLHEVSMKELLMLKLDEGDARGPVGIRVKSFIETVRARRKVKFPPKTEGPLYPAKFLETDKQKRTVLVPNLSYSFSILATAYFRSLGYNAVQLPLGGPEAFALGKKYVHNDICFPAQVNIGENLLWIQQHPEIPHDQLCVGLSKNCENCRAVQYATLARKALDEMGYADVPIITTGKDTKDMHPGFKLGLPFQLHMLWGLTVMDCIETIYRRSRPYELHAGDTQRVYDKWMPKIMEEIAYTPNKEIAYPKTALLMLDQAIEEFNKIEVDSSYRKPRVALLGEILMNYHAGANGHIEEYLINNGMEVYLPGMTDFFRVDEVVRREKLKRGLIAKPIENWLIGGITAKIYTHAVKTVQKHYKNYKLYEHHADCYELVKLVGDIIDPTYNTGEGWLIPGEILYNAPHGINSFIIVQPFACLANHISGRGLTKAVKARYPHIQVLSLDYDPDTSFANIENRLQMLIINARDLEKSHGVQATAAK
jgi:predicted nucleotide-binding protein (sugar kinase/HSP70/actin superfamily)